MPERSLKRPFLGYFCALECALRRNNFSTGPINFQCTGGSPDFFLKIPPLNSPEYSIIEKNSFVGIANPEPSGLEQLALVFEQFLLLQHVLL